MAFNMGLMQRAVPPGEVLVSATGCLGPCEQGPTVVVYPEAVWYHVPSAEDAQEVLETHVVGGKVVERLLIDNIP